jgi:hypothetical protein
MRLTANLNCYPSTMLLSGLTPVDPEEKVEGAFAAVIKYDYHGDKVAVKKFHFQTRLKDHTKADRDKVIWLNGLLQCGAS